MALLRPGGLLPALFLLLLGACGTDARDAHATGDGDGDAAGDGDGDSAGDGDGDGPGEGDGDLPPLGDGDGDDDSCLHRGGGSVPIEELLEERLPQGDAELTETLCELACWNAVDQIAENTGDYELITCQADLDLVRACQSLTFGGAGGAGGAENAQCNSSRTAVAATCDIDYFCGIPR